MDKVQKPSSNEWYTNMINVHKSITVAYINVYYDSFESKFQGAILKFQTVSFFCHNMPELIKEE
jgi:hypothetical protein